MDVKNQELVKVSILLKRMFSKNMDEMDALGLLIQRDGIIQFLKNLESYEISSELYEKLYALRILVFTLEDLESIGRKEG